MGNDGVPLFSGLARCDEIPPARLGDGTTLEPRSKLHMMYCNLLPRVEEHELMTERDVMDLHANLVRSVEALGVVGQDSWCIYVDMLGGRDGLTPYELDLNALYLGTFNSIDSFMLIYNQIPVARLSAPLTLRIFRAGISPRLDDPLNVDGGRWASRTPSVNRATLWLDVVISLLHDTGAIYKNGCVLHANAPAEGGKRSDSIQLWVHSRSPGTEATIRAYSQNLSYNMEHSLHFNYMPNTPSIISSARPAPMSEASDTYSRASSHTGSYEYYANKSNTGGSPTGGYRTYSHQPYLPDPPSMYPKPVAWNSNTVVRSIAPQPAGHQQEGEAFSPLLPRNQEGQEANTLAPQFQRSTSALSSDHSQRTSQSSHSGRDAVQDPLDQPQPTQDQSDAALKKKKKNKPDKHQRERIRRKRQKQAMLEQAMSEMLGVKCCECELQLACAKCDECPEDRKHFCGECFEKIHLVGKRQKHKAFISFEAGVQPDALGDGCPAHHLVDRTVTGKVHGVVTQLLVTETSAGNMTRCPTQQAPEAEEYPFLQCFRELAPPFVQYITAELGSVGELRGFTEGHLQRITDTFFDEHASHATPLQRGKATKELIAWAARD
eukprot:TRINITY_DN7346_c0_g2_i2.p1 TRINITY_DN7346_c0_g2~~TRINITY_DN7346_c0_g2_i2.p1  ORF type:complete len:628 (+),score=248.63 TRINITY_DN7346_c0_g2_i2:68-1885(+)